MHIRLQTIAEKISCQVQADDGTYKVKTQLAGRHYQKSLKLDLSEANILAFIK